MAVEIVAYFYFYFDSGGTESKLAARFSLLSTVVVKMIS